MDNQYAPMDPASASIVKDNYWINKAPEQYREPIRQAAQQNNIPPETLVKMLTNESNFNPNAIGPQTKHGNALGMSQMLPSTAAGLGYSPQDLMNPLKSIAAGGQYLGQLNAKYHNPEYALAAYNTGPGNMDKILAGKMKMPDETTNYLSKAAAMSGQPVASSQTPAIGYGNPQIALNNGFGNHSDTRSNLNNDRNAGMMARSPFPNANELNLPNAEQPEGGLLALVQNFNMNDKRKLGGSNG